VHESPAAEIGASLRVLSSDLLSATGIPTDNAPTVGTSNRDATEGAIFQLPPLSPQRKTK